MSTFCTRDDYEAAIRGNILDAIIDFNDGKLDIAESRAISEMGGYLNARYDTEAIFAATGNDRNPLMVMYCVDIALYHLHSVLNPKKVPDHRKERFDQAKQWLADVAAGMINPPDLPRITDGSRDYVLFGSNTKRNNHI